MKDKLIPLILVLFVGWASYAYQSVSAQKQVGLDKAYLDFGGLADVLPPNANVSVRARRSPNADSTDMLRGFMFIRLVLAPRYFTFDSTRYDTVLTLFDHKPTEAEALAVVHGKQMLWKKMGADCLYLLTCATMPKPQ